MKPVTILQLAKYRGAKSEEDGAINGSEFDRVGLAIMGGCQACGATLSAYNAFPSKAGYWRCADDIGDSGYSTVEEANAAIFTPATASLRGALDSLLTQINQMKGLFKDEDGTIAEAIEAAEEALAAPAPNNGDNDALLAIQELLDGVEWNSDTTEAIAEIMTKAGYRIRDLDDPEEPCPGCTTIGTVHDDQCKAAAIVAKLPNGHPPTRLDNCGCDGESVCTLHKADERDGHPQDDEETPSVLSCREYADMGGVVCPWCQSGDIEGRAAVVIDNGICTQPVDCKGCGRAWLDYYHLHDFKPEA